MDIAVVGAGRAGTAMAVLLARAGHHIVGVSSRGGAPAARRFLPGVSVAEPSALAERADVVIIATPDDTIEEVCAGIAQSGAFSGRQFVLHLSGATPLDALSAAKASGAHVLSLHPLQTFPDPATDVARVPGSGMAVTAEDPDGYRMGEELASDVGARPFRIDEERKPLYHAGAVFASNYVVAVAALAERILEAAGVEDPHAALVPLFRAESEAVADLGVSPALTGPAARGDTRTISANISALSSAVPSAVEAYVVLARVALDVAAGLPADRRAAVEDVLSTWT